MRIFPRKSAGDVRHVVNLVSRATLVHKANTLCM